MEVRIARLEDLPRINEIYNQAVRQKFCTAHLQEVSIAEREHWFAAHHSSRYPVFVALAEDSVMGWSSLGPYREDRQALAHVAEVSYYVAEESRGKGVGSRLMSHAMQIAGEFGYSVLIAILLHKNPASIALLKKFGFEEWGRMPGIAKIADQIADHLYYGIKL